MKTYTKMIRSHPDWLFAGVFCDVESGLRRSGRTGLDKMLMKAAKGKIDYIVTKSISRLSRDTLEVLKAFFLEPGESNLDTTSISMMEFVLYSKFSCLDLFLKKTCRPSSWQIFRIAA